MERSRCLFFYSQISSLSARPLRAKETFPRISSQLICLILFIVLLFALSGCAGIQYADKVQARDITQLDKKETTSKVLANAEEWRNSGVMLKKGLKYKLAATGSWSAGALCGETSPDGLGAAALCYGGSATYMGKGSASMLIGKIGESGSPFPVGNGLELTPPDDGILFFRINDTPLWMADNSGSVDVITSLVGSSTENIVKYKDASKENVSRDHPASPRPPGQESISSASLESGKDLPKLAVWDLVPRDTRATTTQELTSILVSEITRLRKFEVYSQENVRTLAGFTEERMKLGCTSTQCLTALGQMDVTRLVSGSVGKIGDTYSISLNLFNTQNAKAQNAVSEFCRSENELIEMIQKAVRNLLTAYP
jgi:hypothetical protein